MSQKTVLVIDDSATIRRLVDSTLTPAGYHVVLCANAEDGVREAAALVPDLILLDHQLPGTTGFEVCQQLLAAPEICRIPVVISSTLRKKAYAEYTDLPNVVDMLPKPYAGELLTTTVSNALETGALVVASQSQGTAVPEVIGEMEDADFSGTFQAFTLREVIDFLNNGSKSGVLEVEIERGRISFYVHEGRLQSVMSSGIDTSVVTRTLPVVLSDLAPVLNMTVGGRMCSELDGLVQLLDRKVLDPRLLRMLLRHQAAMLVWECFADNPQRFRFESGRQAPPLFQKLALEISLAGLLVEGALRCEEESLPEEDEQALYVRLAIRGQNLDRSGLAANHMKVLGHLAEPISIDGLAELLKWDRDEIRRVLVGLCRADLAQMQTKGRGRQVIALESNVQGLKILRPTLANPAHEFSGKVVRDRLALQLLLRRTTPDVLIVSLDTEQEVQLARKLQAHFLEKEIRVCWVGIAPDSCDWGEDLSRGPVPCDGVLQRPYSASDVVTVLAETLNSTMAQDLEEPELVAAESDDI